MEPKTQKDKMMKGNNKKSVNDINQKNSLTKIVINKEKIFTTAFKNSKISLWKKMDFMKNYAIQEEFLDELFKQHKSNSKERDVFIKVKVLDSFYSTNLKEGLDSMVTNIVKYKKFDYMLNNGDF